MSEPANLQDIVPLGPSIPAAPLESILCTDELRRRPGRPPDYAKENAALAALVGALADSPATILQTLADKILEVLDADSAGLSLLTRDGKRFYWAAIAGAWNPHLGGGTPRDFGPCGDVLDRNITMLFTHWERRYPYLSSAMPLAEEGLLVPFYVNGKSVGTIWAIAHRNHRKFDSEDQRLLESMGRFASAAYQTVESIEELKSEIAAREKAQTELRELTDSLEAQVRARTQELERSEASMAEAQRLSRTGSWHLNVRTGEVLWSREFFDILGFDPENTKPSYSLHLERIHPDDRSRFQQVRSAAIEAKRDYNIEYRLLLPGGTTKHVHAIGHCVENKSGDMEYIASVMDVTQRRLAEDALRRSEAFLADAQRLSSTGSLSWRVATNEMTWSEELHRICGPGSRVHPEDVSLFDKMVEHARDGGTDFEHQLRLLMSDRSIKYLHAVAHAMRDRDGQLEYIAVLQDVTQRRLSEEALHAAHVALAHANRVATLGEISATIAHEVNQPLATIRTNGETSLRWLDRSEPNVAKARDLIRRMLEDAGRAAEIIDRIRATAAQRAPERKFLSLGDVVTESMVFLRHEFQSKNVAVSVDLAPALPPVAGDGTQLQQVVVNLAVNAVQAMVDADTTRRRVSIRTRLSDSGMVSCAVEDSGPGIDPAHLPRLFDSFFTTKDAGMGLGLPISRSIIEAHDGEIRADNESALGGARFSFALPAGRVANAE